MASSSNQASRGGSQSIPSLYPQLRSVEGEDDGVTASLPPIKTGNKPPRPAMWRSNTTPGNMNVENHRSLNEVEEVSLSLFLTFLAIGRAKVHLCGLSPSALMGTSTQ